MFSFSILTTSSVLNIHCLIAKEMFTSQVTVAIGDNFLSVMVQALKMRYFSNRPGPTPGPQLPRPNCAVEALREKETVGLKRKIGGLDSSNE